MNLFQYFTSEFSAVGVDSPEAEAKLVIESLYQNDAFKDVEKIDLKKFYEVLERRRKREPIQYILGKAFFSTVNLLFLPLC